MGAVSGGVGGVVAGLSSEAFSKGIILRTQEVLKADSVAFRGPLSLTRTLAWGTEETSGPESPKVAWPSWTIFSLIGIVGLPLLGVICVLVTRRKTQSGPTATAAEQSVLVFITRAVWIPSRSKASVASSCAPVHSGD